MTLRPFSLECQQAAAVRVNILLLVACRQHVMLLACGAGDRGAPQRLGVVSLGEPGIAGLYTVDVARPHSVQETT